MIIHNATFVHAAATWAAMPPPKLAEVAFIGRSNVGKSSVLNALLGRKALARTSGTPGKTQALNFYRINVRPDGSGGFTFVDVPGLGYAKVSQGQRDAWHRLIGQYVAERETLRALCLLVDSRHPPTKTDEAMFDLVLGESVPYSVILTKADKLSRNEQARATAALKRHLAADGVEVPIFLTSATKRDGFEPVWTWIESLLGLPTA